MSERVGHGPTVLIVDDQPVFVEAVAFELELAGFRTLKAQDGQRGLAALKSFPVALILSDVRMPVWDGSRFLDEVRRLSAQSPPFVFMTGFSDLAVADAYARGANGYLGKPSPGDELLETVRRLLQPTAERWLSRAGSPAPGLELSLDLPPLGQGSALGSAGLYLELPPGVQIGTLGPLPLARFDLRFAGGPLARLGGTGQVRWHRRGAVGLEFESVDEASLPPLLQLLAETRPRAVIPSGPAKAVA